MSYLSWEDHEKDKYGIIRGGLSGQSGYMPPELHLKKLEQTHMYEREDLLDDHYRDTLKDRTPDAPALAQDLRRETQNVVRSEVLNLRHSGARTSAEPIHPDLFLGFTERDERGYHTSGPDLRNVNRQSRARTKFKDLRNDVSSDWTIPESHRSELKVIRDIRSTIAPSKQRLKIFTTSKDSRSTRGGTYQGQQRSGVVKTTCDGVILDLNDATETHQRSDNTKLKGDTIKVGYRQTGDHIFKVAQYSILSKKAKNANIHEANKNARTDHNFDVHPSEITTRLMVNMMKETERRKYLGQFKNDVNEVLSNSEDARNRIAKFVEDISKAQQSTVETADRDELGYMGGNIKKVKVWDPISHTSVIVDKDIFDKVNEHKNISFVKNVSDFNRFNIQHSEGIKRQPGDEVQVYVYSRKSLPSQERLNAIQEHQWYETDFTPVYKSNHTKYSKQNKKSAVQEFQLDPTSDQIFDRYAVRGNQMHWQARDKIDDFVFDNDYVNDKRSDVYSARKMAGRSR